MKLPDSLSNPSFPKMKIFVQWEYSWTHIKLPVFDLKGTKRENTGQLIESK